MVTLMIHLKKLDLKCNSIDYSIELMVFGMNRERKLTKKNRVINFLGQDNLGNNIQITRMKVWENLELELSKVYEFNSFLIKNADQKFNLGIFTYSLSDYFAIDLQLNLLKFYLPSQKF